MKAIKIISVLFLIFALTGCVNLKGVKDYADESSKLLAYTELTTRFCYTYEREQPYISGEADLRAQDSDKKCKAAYGDLLKIHQTLSLYMQTLATLAGEDTLDLSKQVDSLAGGIKAYPDIGIDEKYVDASSSISKVITKWITSLYQERSVRGMVKNGDAHLQTMLEGLLSLVRLYKKTNDNERRTVLGLFEAEIPYTDKLLATLARVHVQSKTLEYNNVQLKFDLVEKGIKSIADGHNILFEHADKLSKDEVKVMISKSAQDIKTIRENLQIH
jgi:hypothetical protein